jgi:hypothetical protein
MSSRLAESDRLTREQCELWDALDLGVPTPSGAATLEQARNLRVLSFRHICAFEGLPVPSDGAVLAEIDRRAEAENQ